MDQYLNLYELNKKLSAVANLLRWGLLPLTTVDINHPIKPKMVLRYLNQMSAQTGIRFENKLLISGDKSFHPYEGCSRSIVSIDDNTDSEKCEEIEKIASAALENRVALWFQLPNNNHHVYRIYVDNRQDRLKIYIAMAEIIDDSFCPAIECKCNAKCMSDYDSDFDSLFFSSNEDEEEK